MRAADATLEEVDGRPALRFERVFAHPVERVWAALTEPEEQSAWHPTPARFEPRAGGRATWEPGGRVEGMEDGEVTAWEPPRLLAYTWAVEAGRRPDHLRWELRPHDDGCLLVLVHRFENRPRAANYGAGWHICFEGLAATLDGRDDAPGHEPDGPWGQLNDEYQRRFGISPERAFQRTEDAEPRGRRP